LFDEGVFLVRPRDITIDPSFMGLYMDCHCEMMSLMQYIIGASRVLTTMRDAGQHHVTANTLDDGGDDDD